MKWRIFLLKTIQSIIKERRSVSKFKDLPFSTDMIIELLNVAIWAPNHKLSEPWRFILVQGEGKKRLANAVLDSFTAENKEKIGEKTYNNLVNNVPVHLVVVVREDENPVRREEDYAATASLIQNFQLAAWEQGIGMVWKTSGYTKSAQFREALQIEANERVVGLLQMGYPEMIPQASSRIPAEQKLTIIQN